MRWIFRHFWLPFYRSWALRHIQKERLFRYGRLRLRVPPGVFHPGIFFSTPMNLGTVCNYWEADFLFRMWGGSGGDGMAFVVAAAIPATTQSGGLLGMPANSLTGFAVCFDSKRLKVQQK